MRDDEIHLHYDKNVTDEYTFRANDAINPQVVESGYCTGIGAKAMSKLIRGFDNIFIGHNAGADIEEENNVIILGDNIRSLDPEKHPDALFIGRKMAIGKTILGIPCNLQEIILHSILVGPHQDIINIQKVNEILCKIKGEPCLE